MFFLMLCHHHDGEQIPALRDKLRPSHRDWVASGGNGLARVLTGSAMWNDAGTGIGNFGVLEASDEAAARAFAEGDPFFREGVVRDLQLIRLADSFQAARIDPLTKA